jgi:hypothetical protein
VDHITIIVPPITNFLKLMGYIAVGMFALLGAVSLLGAT